MPEHAVILLAEDEEDYVLLVKKAFAEANLVNPLQVVSTGYDAMAYLKGDGKYANRDEYPLPDLLLLDIKLPGYSGLELTAWVRSQPGLAGLRIVILTSSEELKDINDAYRLGANSFLLKPYDFGDLIHLSKVINEFWLYLCKCPESFRAPKERATIGNPERGQIASKGENAGAQSLAEPAAPRSNDPVNCPVVLVIEDNPLNAELVSELLQASGIRVHQAGTAPEGIEKARKLLPDLILMDFSLPGMNGLTAAKILKADPATRHLRIVGFTADVKSGEADAGRNAGFDGYLTKPIETRTFVHSVKSFLMEKEKKV